MIDRRFLPRIYLSLCVWERDIKERGRERSVTRGEGKEDREREREIRKRGGHATQMR
jgi:hypothetical protein